MKRMSFRSLTLISICLGLIFACNKTHYTPALANAIFQSDVETQASDQVRIPSEIDAIFNDIDTVLRYKDSINNGPDSINSFLCAAYRVIKNYADTPNTLEIQYGNPTCDGLRYRIGTVTIYLTPDSNWNNPGITVGVNFSNLKTVWLADHDSTTINGTFYYVDSTGGDLGNFNASSTPIVHAIIGVNATILFENQITSTWQIGRRRLYTYNGGKVITTTGIDTAGGLQNVTEFGGNRYGNGFITSVTTPLVVSEACHWQITGGSEQIVNPAGTTILTFGVDSSGNATTGCPASGNSYYMKAAWTGTGENPFTGQIPYTPYY